MKKFDKLNAIRKYKLMNIEEWSFKLIITQS